MKREDIERAAFKYGCEQQVVPCSGGELEKGFIAGADWRIKSVWHDTNELPTKSGYLAVLCHNGIMEMRYHSVGIGFLEKTLQGYSQWAYIEDLLPDAE